MSSISKFFNTFDKVICVSLESSTDRRKHIQNLVSAYQINNFEFLDAVPGNSPVVKEYFDQGLVKQYPDCFRCGQLECGKNDCNNTLINPQVATFLSYVKLWRSIVDQRLSVLIIEDDVVLNSSAENVCATILDKKFLDGSGLYASHPMLVRFGWALCKEHDSEQEFSTSREVRMANPAHAINSAMAKLLLMRFKRIETTVDVYQHRICATAENSITCHPPLFYEMSWSTGEVESCIRPKNTRIEYLEKHNLSSTDDYARAVQNLKNHRHHTLYRKILVYGHPRCGSGYAAALLTSCGLDIGHEAMLGDGISSWMFSVVDAQNPYALDKLSATRNFTYFKYQIHPVRDPRTAIASILTENRYADKSFLFRQKHIIKEYSVDIGSFSTGLERAVASLVYWSLLVARQKPDLVFRIEDQADVLIAFLKDKKLIAGESSDIVLPEKNINSGKPYKGIVYKNPEVRDSEFLMINNKLLKLLNAYCEKYGYSGFPD